MFRTKSSGLRIPNNLPWDIVHSIVEAIPPARLLPFLLASRSFRSTAEPLLYRHINLSNCPRRSIHFLYTILNRPELGQHVITSQVADRFRFVEPGELFKINHRLHGRLIFWHMRPLTYPDRAVEAMHHFVNVKAVSFHGTAKDFNGLAHLHSITKFRVVDASVIVDLGSILDSLPLLTHLTVPIDTGSTPLIPIIHPSHAPFLDSLACDTDVAKLLVPGRPVRELITMFPGLRWEQLPSAYEVMEMVSQGSVPLVTLGVAAKYAWFGDVPEVLLAIARSLPGAEVLRLAFWFDPEEEHHARRVLETLSQSLESFTSLRVLSWNGCHGTGAKWFSANKKQSPSVHLAIIRAWSELCPTLQEVVFPNGSIWKHTPGEWKFYGTAAVPKVHEELIWSRMLPEEGWNGEPTFQRDLKRDWPQDESW